MTPLQYSILLIVGATVLGAALLYGLFSLFVPAPGPVDDDRGLVARANALRPPRTVFGRMDRDFEDMVRGTQWDMSTDRAIEIILLVGAVFGLLGYVFFDDLFACLGMFALGMFVAFAFFAAFRYRRRRVLQEQLPDGCFQIARCLRSGLGMTASVEEAAEYSPPPLGLVFASTYERLRMGAGPGAAFARTAEDVRLTDFDLLAAVVQLHEEVGGNLPELLDRLAADIRARNQYRGYFRSATALARATTFFVAAAAPVAAILSFLFFPDLFLNFFRSSIPASSPAYGTANPIYGWALLAAAVVLWIIGVIWSLVLIRRHEEY